eukprot:4053356-Amphidinium_carterae.1
MDRAVDIVEPADGCRGGNLARDARTMLPSCHENLTTSCIALAPGMASLCSRNERPPRAPPPSLQPSAPILDHGICSARRLGCAVVCSIGGLKQKSRSLRCYRIDRTGVQRRARESQVAAAVRRCNLP